MLKQCWVGEASDHPLGQEGGGKERSKRGGMAGPGGKLEDEGRAGFDGDAD